MNNNYNIIEDEHKQMVVLNFIDSECYTNKNDRTILSFLISTKNVLKSINFVKETKGLKNFIEYNDNKFNYKNDDSNLKSDYEKGNSIPILFNKKPTLIYFYISDMSYEDVKQMTPLDIFQYLIKEHKVINFHLPNSFCEDYIKRFEYYMKKYED